MPLTKEQIRRTDNRPDCYVSPNFGDGGWHTTPGMQRFTTEWEPRNDVIMVQILPPKPMSSILIMPENAAPDVLTREGIVLKTGPGKWVEGKWRWVGRWRWIPGYRRPMDVKPGMKVLIGQFHDWQSVDAGFGKTNIVICREADVRVFS